MRLVERSPLGELKTAERTKNWPSADRERREKEEVRRGSKAGWECRCETDKFPVATAESRITPVASRVTLWLVGSCEFAKSRGKLGEEAWQKKEVVQVGEKEKRRKRGRRRRGEDSTWLVDDDSESSPLGGRELYST